MTKQKPQTTNKPTTQQGKPDKLQSNQEIISNRLSQQTETKQPQTQREIKASDITTHQVGNIKSVAIINDSVLPINVSQKVIDQQFTITINSDIDLIGDTEGKIKEGALIAAKFLMKYPVTLAAILRAAKSKGFLLRLTWYEVADQSKPDLDVQHHYEIADYKTNDIILAFQHERQWWMKNNMPADYVIDYICPACRRALVCNSCKKEVKAHQLELV